MRNRYHDARKQGIPIDTLWQRARQIQRAICAEHGIPTGAIPTYRLR